MKPGSDTGFQWGISPVATGDSGLCPENPQAFRERLERKLQQGYDLFYNSRRVERVRQSLAEDKMELYVSGMATLGYTETQAAQMLLNRRKG